jgi:hypothetical protein
MYNRLRKKFDGYEKFDSLYEQFLDLTADGKRLVVETARSLLEAQRDIKTLLETIGIKTPPNTGTGKQD